MGSPVGNSRIPELDGLRGLAVGMVLVWHYLPCQLTADGGLISSILRRGLYLAGSGVDLFFVLSSFLIFGILLDNAGSPNLLRVFYLRRACRILPVYFLVLGAYFVLSRMAVFPASASEWMFGDPLHGSRCVSSKSRSFASAGGMPLWRLTADAGVVFMGPSEVDLLKHQRRC